MRLIGLIGLKRRWVSSLLVVLLLAVGWHLWSSFTLFPRPAPSPADPPSTAQQAFYREHPGEKPLNWKIAAAAEKIREEQAMGKFVLGIVPGKLGNDCSDYTASAYDEGLGLGGRCYHPERQDHIILPTLDYRRRNQFVDYYYWRPGRPVMPGDLVRVHHSPHYTPYPGACGHVGIVGTDGMVYDFSKLKSWSEARYGRNEFSWFIRHCGEKEVIIGRLKDEYRFLQRPIPSSLVPTEK